MKKTAIPLSLLGLPFSQVRTEEAVFNILRLIEMHHRDLRPRYVTAANLRTITPIQRWNLGEARYPELLQIFRDSSVTTTDAGSLMFLSRFLGEALPEKISVADLFSQLAEKLNSHKLSCFLLGGNEKVLKLTHLYIQALYPDLKITGTAYPLIDIQGVDLHHAEEKDMLLVEQINRAAPDVLFLNLGNPKQEIWYNRVKNRLHVPVTMGVDDAFEQITGIRQKAPSVFQRLSRAFYAFYGLLKLIYQQIPLILYHNTSRLLFNLLPNKRGGLATPNTQLFISPHQTIAVVKLPSRIDCEVSKTIGEEIDDLFSQDVLLFDFQKVRHIDLSGLGLMIRIWQRALREKKQLYSFGISSDIALLLRLHRIFDLVRDSHCAFLHDLISRLNQNPKSSSFYDSIQQDHQRVMISFFGRFDHELDVEVYLKKIEPIIHQKECYLDFTYCTYIDNRAIGFLVKLAERRNRQQVPLKLFGVSKQLKKQLHIAKVSSSFEFIF